MDLQSQQSGFEGALLGLALGDALGAPLEGGVLERGLWRLIGKTPDGRARWTDDTQMAVDLAESIIAHGRIDQDDIAHRFAGSYRWSRGYGPGAARVLKAIRAGVDWRSANTLEFAEGSFGNGAAMRAPIVGLFCSPDLRSLPSNARNTAVITHAHPHGQDGAVLVAIATALAVGRKPIDQILQSARAHLQLNVSFQEKLAIASSWLSSASPAPREVRQRLGNSVVAAESCVTAVYVALRFLNEAFEDMLSFIADCSGDVDTIGAMAGAVWGAHNRAANLPDALIAKLESADRLRALAQELHHVTVQARAGS